MVAQAEQAAADGGLEIVLTGVNIGDFGRSTGESFSQLVHALDRVEGIKPLPHFEHRAESAHRRDC